MKKLIAVLLTLVMALGCVSAVAFADDDAEIGIPAECTCAGDINYDGFVNAADARLALRYAVRLETDETFAAIGEASKERANVAGDDNEITAADARYILRMAVRLEPAPAHKVNDVVTAAKWTADGKTSHVCQYCGQRIGADETAQSKLDVLVDEANAWAEANGAANLIKGISENDGAKLTAELNVDAIWDGIELKDGVFDGFLTKLGAYVSEKFDGAVVTYKDSTVYTDGKLQNTAVKNALFDIGAGFFYKIANLKDDGAYGVYDLTIDGEAVQLTVKLTGSEDKLAKVKSFAATIADHISADTSTPDLKITVDMPTQLMNTVNARGGIDKVNASTVGACLTALTTVELEDVLGSQQSAVNKLCATICKFDSFVNKVLGKVTAATVTVDGAEVPVLKTGAVFAPATDDYEGFLAAAIDLISDELKTVKVGAFAAEDGTYELRLNVTVDVGNADLMERGSISETIILVIRP